MEQSQTRGGKCSTSHWTQSSGWFPGSEVTGAGEANDIAVYLGNSNLALANNFSVVLLQRPRQFSNALNVRSGMLRQRRQ
jgi:hypothetical protein